MGAGSFWIGRHKVGLPSGFEMIKKMGLDRTDFRMLRNFLQMMMRDRFLGSGLGIIWAIANPVLMLAIFTFVFGFVFKSKLPGADTSIAYVIWLISGYGPWIAVAEGLSASANSVTSNAGLVKNLAFRTELLPVAAAIVGIIPLLVALVYLIVLLAFNGTAPSIAWLSIVPVVVLQFVFVAGLGLALGAVNVFVRDVSFILPNVLLMVMFSSPILYPIEALPSAVRPIVAANPFYLFAEGFRRPLVTGEALPILTVAYLAALSFGVLFVGLMVFRRLKPYFESRL